MATSLTEVVGQEALSRFRDGGTVARGLPAAAYVSEAFWELERDRLFPNCWSFVGFAHELAKPGDVRPFSLAGRPILLVKDAAGEVRGFHNVCSHRCLKLVDAPANVGKAIRCPYHAWTYDLSGALRAAPYFGGPETATPDGFDMADHGLRPVRIAVWHDWIFANLDGEAEPFEQIAAPMEAMLDGLDLSRIRHLTTIDLGDVRCNWKLLMENFIEPYHVQFVHKRTTDQPLLDHYTVKRGACLGSAVDISRKGEGRTGSLGVSSRYLTLFPNFILGRYIPDQLGVYWHETLGPGLTRQRRAIYATEENPIQDDEVEALRTLWTTVHREDHAMCERMQDGRRSEVADSGGVLSPHWEDSVRRFQELIIEKLS